MGQGSASSRDLAGEQSEVVIVLAVGRLSLDLNVTIDLLVVVLADRGIGLLGLWGLAALGWSSLLCVVFVGCAHVSLEVKGTAIKDRSLTSLALARSWSLLWLGGWSSGCAVVAGASSLAAALNELLAHDGPTVTGLLGGVVVANSGNLWPVDLLLVSARCSKCGG